MTNSTAADLGVVVAALYRFATFPDYESLREPLKQCMLDNDVRGTLLLAAEGINGTIAGTRQGVDAVLSFLGRHRHQRRRYGVRRPQAHRRGHLLRS